MDADIRHTDVADGPRLDSLGKIKLVARRLFVERGYHATKPQDIAREAGLGHGTFYLHYADKRACYLAFLADARTALNEHIRLRAEGRKTLEDSVAAILEAITEFSASQPGLAQAAITDETVIGVTRLPGMPLVRQWGQELAEFIRCGARDGSMREDCRPGILGQAIAGAVFQCWHEGVELGLPARDVADTLTRFVRRGVGP